jgi:enoyl-CoA hydratase/carnithine racemase
MSYETVVYEKRERIAYVTLDRAQVKNAVSPTMDSELKRVWRDFRDDEGMDVAIVTGAGDAFCAGADLKEFIPPLIDATPYRIRQIVEEGLTGLNRGLHRISKPVIAAVNGWALAGGLEFALACDMRIASERAVFGSFEARRGYHHGDGGIVRLVNTCGVGVAMEMLLRAEPIDAHRALQCNLVNAVVPHEELLDTAELWARQIQRNDQDAVRSAKETILDVIGKPLEDQLRIEAWNAYSCPNTRTPERLQAFHDKTDPGRAGTHATPL